MTTTEINKALQAAHNGDILTLYSMAYEYRSEPGPTAYLYNLCQLMESGALAEMAALARS